jgi:hypothetical protein
MPGMSLVGPRIASSNLPTLFRHGASNRSLNQRRGNPPLRIRERELCAERLRGNVLPLPPRTSVYARYRARGAVGGAIESPHV